MNVAMSKAAMYSDYSGLDQMQRLAQSNSPRALKKAANKFEAVFVETMIETMREASQTDGMFDSRSMKMYRSMFDHRIAKQIASGKSLGIAEMLTRQLGRGG